MKYLKLTIATLLFIPSIVLAQIGIGWNATSSTAGVIQPNKINGALQAVRATFFTATSTDFSTFPYASTTQLSVSSRAYFGSKNSMITSSGGSDANMRFYPSGNIADAGFAFTRTAGDVAEFGHSNGVSSFTIKTPVKLGALTSNGFVKTSSGNGTLSVDTSTYPTVSGGSAGMLTSWLDGTTLTATSAPTVAYITATSTAATSTFNGNIQVMATSTMATTTSPCFWDGSSYLSNNTFDCLDNNKWFDFTSLLSPINSTASDIWRNGNLYLVSGVEGTRTVISTSSIMTVNQNTADSPPFGYFGTNLYIASANGNNNLIGGGGGNITIQSGNAGTSVSSGARSGGDIRLLTGSAVKAFDGTKADGAKITIKAGAGDGANNIGGNVTIDGGTGTTTGNVILSSNGGNVGIGTTTPGTSLSIGNTGNDTINISATATSTFGSGINLRTGCFAVNGSCITGGGASLSGGSTGALTYWTSDTTVGATTSPTVGYVTATSTIASQLPYASTTAISATDIYSTDISTTDLFSTNVYSSALTSGRFTYATAGGKLTDSSVLTNGGSQIVFDSNSSSGSIQVRNIAVSSNSGFIGLNNSGSPFIADMSNGDFGLKTDFGDLGFSANNGTNLHMIIKNSTGNIGMGTSTPGTLLSLGNTGNDTVNISPTATSTFGSGINLRTGCFAVNGVCVGGGGSGASSTLLADDNTFSGTNTFTNQTTIATAADSTKLLVGTTTTSEVARMVIGSDERGRGLVVAAKNVNNVTQSNNLARFEDASGRAILKIGNTLSAGLGYTMSQSAGFGEGSFTGLNSEFFGGFDIAYGGVPGTLILGAENNLVTRTNNTTKVTRIVMAPYSSSHNALGLLIASTNSGTSLLGWGGGSTVVQGATQQDFFTATAVNTVGVSRLTINSQGLFGFNKTSPTNLLDVQLPVSSTAKTGAFSTLNLTNTATSTTASIIKSGISISSTGTWSGSNASNIGLYVSSVTGGTNNYDAIFNGGGNVGIGTTTPQVSLAVEGLIQTNEYTVGTLPTCNGLTRGSRAHVTDASAPAFLTTLTGGGAVVAPAFCNGTNWVAN